MNHVATALLLPVLPKRWLAGAVGLIFALSLIMPATPNNLHR